MTGQDNLLCITKSSRAFSPRGRSITRCLRCRFPALFDASNPKRAQGLLSDRRLTRIRQEMFIGVVFPTGVDVFLAFLRSLTV